MRVYSAFGDAVIDVDAARAGYAGAIGERELGWYVLGARPYLPALRRFASPDRASPFEAGGFGRYAYCAGDPINRVDPSGNAWWDWLAMALGAAAAAASVIATLGAAAPVAALALAGMAADVVSVGVELASTIALEAGEERLGGILGWIAMGTGIASVGTAMATHVRPRNVRGARRSAGAGSHLPSGTDDWMKTVDEEPGHFSKATHHAPSGGRRITVVQGRRDFFAREFPGRTVTDRRTGLKRLTVSWKKVPNDTGGINYLADTAVTRENVTTKIRALDELDDDLPIIVLTGGHGDPAGLNWKGDVRLHGAQGYFDEDELDLLERRGLRKSVRLVNIDGIHFDQFLKVAERRAHVIHGYCYGLADRRLMERFGLGGVTSLDI